MITYREDMVRIISVRRSRDEEVALRQSVIKVWIAERLERKIS